MSIIDGTDKFKSKTFKKRSPIGYAETFAGDLDPPPVLLPGIIPCSVFSIVGEGGLSKSTIVLWMMIRMLLRKEIFGRQATRQGPCVYVTAEDTLDTTRYRIRQICKAMGISEHDKRFIGENLFVHDMSGQVVRMIKSEKDGNLSFTALPQELAEMYTGAGVIMLIMDPMVFFGPGERYTNDAESMLMVVGRYISSELGNAAVGYVHHTSKMVARQKIDDQYAGRGGAAFADNSRGVLVLTKHTKSERSITYPPGITPEDIKKELVTKINVAKFSYGPREREPLWVVRGEFDSYVFEGCRTPSRTDKEKEAEAKKVDQDRQLDVLVAIYDFLVEQQEAKRYPGMNNIEAGVRFKIDGKKVGKQYLRDCTTTGVMYKFFEEKVVPKGEQIGGKKKYFSPKVMPHLGSGGL